MGKLKRHLKEVVNVTWNYAGRLETQRDHEQNALVGLASEAGEALDTGKKMWFHTPQDRRDELILELGDVIHYFLKVLDVYEITMEEVLESNRRKLAERHPKLLKENRND